MLLPPVELPVFVLLLRPTRTLCTSTSAEQSWRLLLASSSTQQGLPAPDLLGLFTHRGTVCHGSDVPVPGRSRLLPARRKQCEAFVTSQNAAQGRHLLVPRDARMPRTCRLAWLRPCASSLAAMSGRSGHPALFTVDQKLLIRSFLSTMFLGRSVA